jgi:hypothetical protein
MVSPDSVPAGTFRRFPPVSAAPAGTEWSSEGSLQTFEIV